jgi:hypothetical protein
VPGISVHKAMLCQKNRDGRDKPGHDVLDGHAPLAYHPIFLMLTPFSHPAPSA